MKALLLVLLAVLLTGCASVHVGFKPKADPIGDLACGIATAADPFGSVALGVCCGNILYDVVRAVEIRVEKSK